MKILKVGDSQKTICQYCRSLENATFKLRDVPISDGSGLVKNVLVGVCDKCDQVGILPHQSMPVVKKQLKAQRKPVESRLSAHMVDILNLATMELGGSTDFVPNLVKYYIHVMATDEKSAQNIAQFLKSDLAKGKAEKRLSLKGRQIHRDIETLKLKSNITNTTDLIKSVILRINDDVLLKKKPTSIRQLKIIMASVA